MVGEQIADQINEWRRNEGADGFTLMPLSLPGGIADFVDHVVPVLQQQDLFRRDHQADTLRGRLGLDRPASPH